MVFLSGFCSVVVVVENEVDLCAVRLRRTVNSVQYPVANQIIGQQPVFRACSDMHTHTHIRPYIV